MLSAVDDSRSCPGNRGRFSPRGLISHFIPHGMACHGIWRALDMTRDAQSRRPRPL